MAKCDGNGIPRACANKFEDVGERLMRIETKLDALCQSSKTWGGRIWRIVQAVVLLAAGFLLAILRGPKHL